MNTPSSQADEGLMIAPHEGSAHLFRRRGGYASKLSENTGRKKMNATHREQKYKI
jgi:hypothetical protein